MTAKKPEVYDLFVIGGGINGAGIARDAAGRGYTVALAEMHDFASATSSASTKLFHGGLRYLEFFEFRLVRESLIEREVLLNAMPHISWPLRFVLPVYPDMRFESNTPTSRLLSWVMPWMKGRRPPWLIRLGLFLYDRLGGRKLLPATTRLDLRRAPEGAALKAQYARAFEYSDCWVEDSRLTLLNIVDAERRGADIFARTKVTSAVQKNGIWELTLNDTTGRSTRRQARMVVNAAGPWVADVITQVVQANQTEGVRLVRGSHIVTRRLYEHDKCYFFQVSDGRIMFSIPYEEDYTLIGTTDVEQADLSKPPRCSEAEADYMLRFVNRYFRRELTRDDIVWSYSGVRTLYDDGASTATATTRDYVLQLDHSAEAPLLNIFGGKITTYRRLAEQALTKIDAVMQRKTHPWTAKAALPGGDIAVNAVPQLVQDLAAKLPFLDAFTIRRLIRQYGTQCAEIFAAVDSMEALGEQFGGGISALEIDWGIAHEWVRSADDFLWRRSKMGLRVTPAQAAELDRYIKEKLNAEAPPALS